jgi:TonB family protein
MTSDTRRALEGDVVVRVLVSVDAKGKVTAIQAVPGAGPVPAAVTSATFDAVKRFQFEPARRGDEKVAGDIELSFTFRK